MLAAVKTDKTVDDILDLCRKGVPVDRRGEDDAVRGFQFSGDRIEIVVVKHTRIAGTVALAAVAAAVQ